MVAVPNKPVLEVDSIDEWESFLADDPDPVGVRLRVRKNATILPGITYLEALESALCFGWIDGQAMSFDEHYSLQSFSPRRAKSAWSQRNRDRIARLTEEGRMRPGGLAEVERAKADGRWSET